MSNGRRCYPVLNGGVCLYHSAVALRLGCTNEGRLPPCSFIESLPHTLTYMAVSSPPVPTGLYVIVFTGLAARLLTSIHYSTLSVSRESVIGHDVLSG
jgi:hypothetical protein